ncbi:hypothetical protein DdX_12655 [Ditylenchus destructor]|uniref:Uncharacterized protein n=1 Tax=Ditylenchus destructor TaxID=166010 RepID=A0AAD4MUU0_9BILA|nr:hypothetical protein DdX_12655 [Ditylenchus destructor]
MNKCAAAAAVNERHPIKNDSRHGNIGYNFNEFLRTHQKKLLRFGRSDGFFGVCLDRKLFEEFLDMETSNDLRWQWAEPEVRRSCSSRKPTVNYGLASPFNKGAGGKQKEDDAEDYTKEIWEMISLIFAYFERSENRAPEDNSLFGPAAGLKAVSEAKSALD